VYSVKDLLDFSGRHNHKKRQMYNKLAQTEGLSFVPVSALNIGSCLEVESQWCAQRDCTECRSHYGCEKEALALMAELYDSQCHSGILGLIDGKPAGYVLCQKMNEKWAFVYFCKGTIPHFFSFLIYKTFEGHMDVLSINLNDDLGIPGMRNFKRRLGPYEQLRRYSISYHPRGKTE
jgi:hypothetical protein